MAKAYGWGQIRLQITSHEFAWCAPEKRPDYAPALEPSALIATFVAHMDAWCERELREAKEEVRPWAESAQVKGLLEAATRKPAESAASYTESFPPNAERVIGYPNEAYKAYKGFKDKQKAQRPLGVSAGGWEFRRDE